MKKGMKKRMKIFALNVTILVKGFAMDVTVADTIGTIIGLNALSVEDAEPLIVPRLLVL